MPSLTQLLLPLALALYLGHEAFAGSLGEAYDKGQVPTFWECSWQTRWRIFLIPAVAVTLSLSPALLSGDTGSAAPLLGLIVLLGSAGTLVGSLLRKRRASR